MTRYAVFLRGVNVGGVTLKMAAVTRALEAAGFTGVRTILASGNVLLDSQADAATVKDGAERALRDEFGYQAWVLVYELECVAHISAAYPFPRERDGHHSYVTLVSDDDVLRELFDLASDPGPGERIAPGDGVVYWQVPRSATLQSAMGRTMGRKRYKSSTTTRNLRTIDKVLRLGAATGRESR